MSEINPALKFLSESQYC